MKEVVEEEDRRGRLPRLPVIRYRIATEPMHLFVQTVSTCVRYFLFFPVGDTAGTTTGITTGTVVEVVQSTKHAFTVVCQAVARKAGGSTREFLHACLLDPGPEPLTSLDAYLYRLD